MIVLPLRLKSCKNAQQFGAESMNASPSGKQYAGLEVKGKQMTSTPPSRVGGGDTHFHFILMDVCFLVEHGCPWRKLDEF